MTDPTAPLDLEEDRLGYDGNEGLYFDRTKPLNVDGVPMFEECDPIEVCRDLQTTAIRLAEEVKRQKGRVEDYKDACSQRDELIAGGEQEISRLTRELEEANQTIADSARMIPIAGSLEDRIRFLMQAPRTIETGQIDYPKMISELHAKLETERERSQRLREALDKIDDYSGRFADTPRAIARAALKSQKENLK